MVFDHLDKLGANAGYEFSLERIMIKELDDTTTGTILVGREEERFVNGPYITWGIEPYGIGLHSGHYDLEYGEAVDDFIDRITRGGL